jgi:PTH1 family peptidyl-tRNA hydrolase
MKLVIGLGNPGGEYTGTRHNFGFDAISKFARSNDGRFSIRSRFQAETAELNLNGRQIILARPLTYYNASGECARKLLDFYKLTADKLLVVHDDLALPFGTIRVRFGGSAAGNNGIKSLNAHVGPDYWRLRLGTYNRERDSKDDKDYVLGKFTGSERKIISESLLTEIDRLIHEFTNDTLTAQSLTGIANQKSASE